MSKSQIESWISSSNGLDDEDDEADASPTIDVNNSIDDWGRLIVLARRNLLTSRTKIRTYFLRERLLVVASKSEELDPTRTRDILDLLFLTYPRYVDAVSRKAATDVLEALIKRDLAPIAEGKGGGNSLGALEYALGWLKEEALHIADRKTKSVSALSSRFVLISWCCAIYTACLQNRSSFTSTTSWRTIVDLLATLFDSIMDDQPNPKHSVQKSAQVQTRRTIRNFHTVIPTLIETLLDLSSTSPYPPYVTPLLGLAIDVAIRLKPESVQQLGRSYIAQLQPKIIAFYTGTVLMSRTAIPTHSSITLQDFVRNFVTETDLTDGFLPTIEKALLRSPEVSITVTSHFFQAYTHPIPMPTFQRLLTPILSCSKSSNSTVRSESIRLLDAIISKPNTEETILEFTVNELITLPKSGKTTGPDHRATLYAMLALVKPTKAISTSLLQPLSTLLAKETHEVAIQALKPAFTSHLAFLLRENILDQAGYTLLVKDLTAAKPPLRRSFYEIVGEALWSHDGQGWTGAMEALAKTLLPSFETSLKTISTNPLNSPAGPLEGYVSVAVMLHPEGIKVFGPSVQKSPILQSLASTGAKPSFFLWEKVYQKLQQSGDQKWLLRAAETFFSHFKDEMNKSNSLRVQLGLIYIHLAVESSHLEIRRDSIKSLQELNGSNPRLVNMVIRDALVSFLQREPLRPIEPSDEGHSDEATQAVLRQDKLEAVLMACAHFSENTSEVLRMELLAENVIFAHHPLIGSLSRQVWIGLAQRAGIDPGALVHAKLSRLTGLLWEHTSSTETNVGFSDAAFRAATTLAFVAPGSAIPLFISRVEQDLEPSTLESIGETELGIWKTPEGTLFIDVLSSKKQVQVDRKGKDADIQKWEAELRKSLANKKASTTTAMSKADQSLVDAQLLKESKTRKEVGRIRNSLLEGLGLIRSLIAARVDEFRPHVWSLSTLLLRGVLKRGSALLQSVGIDTYLDLSNCCSSRLENIRTFVGIATLRSFNYGPLPEDMLTEPLSSLIVRVLYRLRSLAEQGPLDAPTYSYASPLLTHIIDTGGIATDNSDEAIEQIALVLDFIRFQCGEFSDLAFPRMEAMLNLIRIVARYPQVSKEAVSALTDLGEAIHLSATVEETQTLISSTLAQEVYVRNACLQALQPFDLTELDWSPALWLACHDEDEQNVRLAQRLWEDNGLDVAESFLKDMVPFLSHEHAYVRVSCALAFGEAVRHHPPRITDALSILKDLYADKAKILAPEFDEYGILIERSLDRQDPWQARAAVARTFQHLAPSFTDTEVVPFFDFLMTSEALGDRSPEVRRGMLSAGTAVIDLHGKSRLPNLTIMFETHLSSNSPPSEASDLTKEAVIILFGRLARHLDASDERIPKVVGRLVEALKIPSEVVQSAIADCLPPLVEEMKDGVSDLVDHLLHELFNAPKYAERRGAAYGLAGLVKGRGISALKEFTVMSRLREAMDDKKRYEPRQGALFAFETLTVTLGRLFEPYIIQIIPLLLASFGDPTAEVREATQDAAKSIMAGLSGYGVKLILPSLLTGLDEKQWRTKKGSIELLGSMAFCAPKQLSISLPTVVPRLTGVLTDSHAQVRTSANKSLKQFGEVISNPEIQSLVPVLLKALVDPDKTPSALSALLKTAFVHYIDSPSLALVIPILERGLKERSAETKRKAAQIVGNMASITDSKDFVPYLPRLIPLVHVVLVDPVPEARATAAKALGTLIERLGEPQFPDLVPSLLQTLKTDTSGVDRQGAAQGLSEVLAGLGMERMEGLLPDIITNASSQRAYVREGFMSLLVFLPATFGHRFAPHLARIIPPILNGLADPEEFVRAASMKAGRMIVSNYSQKAIDLLLPELEKGMFDSGWRIRQSSITLVGELLYKVSGISGKAEIEENEEEEAEAVATETSRRALTEVLGKERRDRVLSALYLVRQDAVNVVRQASMHIWKAIVHNTPRTVREILPSLVHQVIALLASPGVDQRETAARTMGELCRKFGEKILGEIVPILREQAASPDAQTREGVCFALSEVIENTNDTQREGFEDEIITSIRICLVDESATVRAAAAQAFDVLQEHMGDKAIGQTIPTLLEALSHPGDASETALQALREIMTVRSSSVFPVLIPTLLTTPITVFNARALASLVTVAGSALSKRLTQILTALIKALETEEDKEVMAAVDDAVRALVGSVSDVEGLHTLMMLLLGWAKGSTPIRRVHACNFFATFCATTQLDFSFYRVDWIRQLVTLLDDRQQPVVEASWNALDELVKSIDKEEMDALVVPLRRTIEGTGAPGRHVPGFSLPKGISPVLPIIFAGLTTGSNEQRENAAYAISDLVERTEENALKPFTTQLTGPLIRVITQSTSYPAGVKSAILTALTMMLSKIPTFIKPFFPQLQRTFVKSLLDPSLAVRNKAGLALGVLMRSQPRVDPIITELVGLVRGQVEEDIAVAASVAVGIAEVVKSAGEGLSENSTSLLVELIAESFGKTADENYNSGVAQIFGGLGASFPSLLRPIVVQHLSPEIPPDPLSSHVILQALTISPEFFYKLDVVPSIIKKIHLNIRDQAIVSRPAREAKDLLRSSEPYASDDKVQGML